MLVEIIHIVDNDWHFGSLSKRELTLRWRCSLSFKDLRGSRFCFSWRQLFWPPNWWSAAKDRWNWSLWWRYHRDCTHRCYCPEGSSFDGGIAVCGFGVTWFYSHYTGEVPCPCDTAFDEVFGDEEPAHA